MDWFEIAMKILAIISILQVIILFGVAIYKVMKS